MASLALSEAGMEAARELASLRTREDVIAALQAEFSEKDLMASSILEVESLVAFAALLNSARSPLVSATRLTTNSSKVAI
jgi:hypothetical protein